MTIVVDSSVLVAVMRGEPEAAGFSEVLRHERRLLGWPTVFETRLVCIRHVPHRIDWLNRFVLSSDTTLVAFDGELEAFASEAFECFGKGRHPASLNFGDCMTYAVARSRNLPLLFKGNDFSQTDVAVHPASVFSL